jgi:curved DNA-binding protein
MSVQYKDYYAVLGVPRSASAAEIKKAFRKLAREYHPDVARDNKRAEDKFKEINEAYEVLGDPAKRQRYDQLGSNWKSGAEFRPPPGGSGARRGHPGAADFEFNFGGTGFSDFFEQVFGARGGPARPSGFAGGFEEPDLSQRGADLESDLMVTLEEALHGSLRTVNVRHAVECEACSGTGRRGQRPCGPCGGSGRVHKSESYQVKVPAGVLPGQRLRLAGRGEAGARGGLPGDLFLRVRFAGHPDFEVEGHNLIYEAALAPWEAVLGTNLSVPTLEGRVNIKVPPGTQNGQKLRVRGRGLPQRAGGRGDILVVAVVQVPTQITDTERKLWEQLAAASRFQPRE